jgi:hypothetical protein
LYEQRVDGLDERERLARTDHDSLIYVVLVLVALTGILIYAVRNLLPDDAEQ